MPPGELGALQQPSTYFPAPTSTSSPSPALSSGLGRAGALERREPRPCLRELPADKCLEARLPLQTRQDHAFRPGLASPLPFLSAEFALPGSSPQSLPSSPSRSSPQLHCANHPVGGLHSPPVLHLPPPPTLTLLFPSLGLETLSSALRTNTILASAHLPKVRSHPSLYQL